jgi:hypothetical protein
MGQYLGIIGTILASIAVMGTVVLLLRRRNLYHRLYLLFLGVSCTFLSFRILDTLADAGWHSAVTDPLGRLSIALTALFLLLFAKEVQRTNAL